MCCLHVDDGLVFGGETSDVFVRAKKDIDWHFTIKERKRLGYGRVDYFGAQLRQLPGFTIEEHMRIYCAKISEMPVDKKAPEDKVLPTHLAKELRSLVMKVYWPAWRLLPQIT